MADGRDDRTQSEEDDDLFAAASAAVSGRPSRDEPADPEPQADEVEPTTAEPTSGGIGVAGPPSSSYDDLFYDDDRLAAPIELSRTSTAGDDDGDGPDDPTDEESGPHWGRRVAIGAVVVLGLLYVGGYFLTGMRMPANATVSGVDVSGQSPTEARATLTRELTPRTERDIQLTEGETQFTIKPADAGLMLDVDASVDEAGGSSSWDPRRMAALFFGDHATDAVVDADQSMFQGVLGTIGEKVDVPVVESQITFPDGKAKPRRPVEGRVVDKAATGEVVRDAYVGDGEPQQVVMKTVKPQVDLEGLREALRGVAKTAVSGPVAIKVGDKTIELPVSAFTPALVVRTQDGAMSPYIDPKKLAAPLRDSTTGIGKEAVDATVRIENGKPVVVPGKEGVGLQPEEMATKLLPAIVANGDKRSVSIEAKVVEPAFTTQDAKDLKITEKISEGRTEYPPAEYRDINQGRAAELINGTIVKPGETFSFNDTVGERTVANGFTTGSVINGGRFREELGGGVSQVVTTLYNAAFFGAMDDVEHHPHAFYIDRYPVGREATVYYGSLDLRFKNSSKYGVLIQAWVDKSGPGRPGKMNVDLWSTKVYDVEAGESARRNFRSPITQYDESPSCTPQAPIGGFDIDIYRTFFKDGKKVKTETDTAVYQAANQVICGKKPSEDGDDDAG